VRRVTWRGVDGGEPARMKAAKGGGGGGGGGAPPCFVKNQEGKHKIVW